jgi:hypothetical protein
MEDNRINEDTDFTQEQLDEMDETYDGEPHCDWDCDNCPCGAERDLTIQELSRRLSKKFWAWYKNLPTWVKVADIALDVALVALAIYLLL